MTEQEYQKLKKQIIEMSADIEKIKKHDSKIMARFNDTMEDYHEGYCAGYKAGKEIANQNIST